jgi:hypothetical protein
MVNVPAHALGFHANMWLGISAMSDGMVLFSAVFRDWHAP